MHKFSRGFALGMTCVILLFLLVGTSFSQQKGKIAGQIIDKEMDKSSQRDFVEKALEQYKAGV